MGLSSGGLINIIDEYLHLRFGGGGAISGRAYFWRDLLSEVYCIFAKRQLLAAFTVFFYKNIFHKNVVEPENRGTQREKNWKKA